MKYQVMRFYMKSGNSFEVAVKDGFYYKFDGGNLTEVTYNNMLIEGSEYPALQFLRMSDVEAIVLVKEV